MKSALAAFTYFGLIYAGCFRLGARERIEAQEMERNGGWVVTSGPTMPLGPLTKPWSATVPPSEYTSSLPYIQPTASRMSCPTAWLFVSSASLSNRSLSVMTE